MSVAPWCAIQLTCPLDHLTQGRFAEHAAVERLANRAARGRRCRAALAHPPVEAVIVAVAVHVEPAQHRVDLVEASTPRSGPAPAGAPVLGLRTLRYSARWRRSASGESSTPSRQRAGPWSTRSMKSTSASGNRTSAAVPENLERRDRDAAVVFLQVQIAAQIGRAQDGRRRPNCSSDCLASGARRALRSTNR